MANIFPKFGYHQIWRQMKSRLIPILIALSLSQGAIYSQGTSQVQPQKRIALVIGNASYINSTLANPESDARSMKAALQSVGFSVYENLSQSQMKKAIDDFGMQLKGNDVGLFYYAGHGIQSKGYNYLIPVDAQLQSEQQVEYDCVQADRVLALMDASGSKVNIIILDACRNNPFERSWTRSATGKGLAFMNAPRGSLIAYATSPGSTASDGSGHNGLYTSAILESMKIPDITILEMFQNVRNIVSQQSNNQQTPWESTSLTGNFYFNTKEITHSEIQQNNQENPSDTPKSNQDKIQVMSLKEASTPDENEYIIDSRDGQQYKTVKIGNQVWMAENLRTTNLNDGRTIPLVTDNDKWIGLHTPAYCWYNNDETNYKSIYGALYNWYTVNTGKLCPAGWHAPTDAEWTTLETYLGGVIVAGDKLKETGTAHWSGHNTRVTNESGFTALPGGYRNHSGAFYGIGNTGNWWSATEGGTTNAWIWSINYFNSDLNRYNFFKKCGYSVRCIKDN